MEDKICVKLPRHSKHLPLWFVTNISINLLFGFSFCHESLRSGKQWCFQFFFHSLSKPSLGKALRNKCHTNPQKIVITSINRQNCSSSDGTCPAQGKFIFAEKPSITAMAEVNRPLTRLGYYGSESCQSRQKTNAVVHCLCQDENVIQKQELLEELVYPDLLSLAGFRVLLVSSLHHMVSSLSWSSLAIKNSMKVSLLSSFQADFYK